MRLIAALQPSQVMPTSKTVVPMLQGGDGVSESRTQADRSHHL
jgi:hypothetical protein